MPLKGKTVFITGGTGGIGRPLVRMLEKAGAAVTVYSQKNQGDLAEMKDHICASLRARTPDILINMAGFNVFDYCERQDLEHIVALNMMVPLRLSQAVLPAMKTRGSGHIVNVGSMTAVIPLPHLTGYVAAKAGLKGFTDSLRRELAGTGIAVTHIVPRAVRTGMNSGARAEINEKTGVAYDDPETVAALIFRAIERKEKEVRIGWPERLFALIQAVCPAIIDIGLQKNRRAGEAILRRHSSTNA
ncbi:MAG: SDR family NAD(P)-dependent oxidoreductase [Micavibrio aeruginosavorus]|uniref:SDR family NAD(P)-dependent oxidoreductase n=1 Tax=Micavibrio aeruginosavorus TaxID=349221 RepID=A0A7T5UHW7_9BACT|nr:MAG: SDR family NAD(P)-dependent oxidoreductase [Micavibrio aeruginosavorus]